MDEALCRLALAAGIEGGYWDGLGTRRELQDDTAQALLRALGFDPDQELDAQATALEQAVFSTTLPPVRLVAPGGTAMIEISLPAHAVPAWLQWRLVLESGLEEFGRAQPERIDDHEPTVIDNVARVRCRLTLTFANPLPLGYHRLHLPTLHTAGALIAVPARCYLPPLLANGGRCWGLAIQLYALRSQRNWGIGDFTDLGALAQIAADAGAALLGLNPLHARHMARPDEASPYAPSSRLALDPMYLDVEAIADYAECEGGQTLFAAPTFQAQLAQARAAPYVQHAMIVALKLPVLRQLFETFYRRVNRSEVDSRIADYHAFVQRGGDTLQHFATFEALRFVQRDAAGTLLSWREWPAEWRDPASVAVCAFRIAHRADIAFQCYLQWQADEQLQRAAEVARTAGMSIGLYRDLAVGAADDGADCWCDTTLIASGISVGAPPDLLNREGQNWGLSPWNPRVLAAREFAPLRAVLSANMQHAGALRIDHVMALTRLFWIPATMKGDAGGYVRYPLEVFAGIVALESQRQQCVVIGEDLGAVPDGLRETLAARGLLSYRVLLFERHWEGDGSFKRPREYPPQALATVVTHDMPPITEYWSGDDIARRAALGLFPNPEFPAEEAARRATEREGLLQLLDELGIRPANADAAAISGALHAAVARTMAMIAVIQIDDILGETTPINIPGTYREYPNWQRKLAVPLEVFAEDPRFSALSSMLRDSGRSG